MVVEAGRRPVEAFAQAAVEVASAVDLNAAVTVLAAATADALEADLVLLRVVEPGGGLVARAVASSGARSGAAWRLDTDDAPELIASVGTHPAAADVRELLAAAAIGPSAVAVTRAEDATVVASLPLGRPPFAALQLFFAEER